MSVPRTSWKEFEAVVATLKRRFHANAQVTENDFICGVRSKKRRQIDISIRYQLGPSNILIIVECKRHTRNVDVETMEGFIGKMRDVRANLGIVIAERGFTDGARTLAVESGVEIYTLEDTRNTNWPSDLRIQFFVEAITLDVFAAQVLNEDGSPVKLEADEIVHLFDVKRPDEEITFDDFIRILWKKAGEPSHEVCIECRAGERDRPQEYRFQVGIRPAFVRFARPASFEFLGITDAQSRVTHTDSFRMVTREDSDVMYYDEPEFWRRSEAVFGIHIRTVAVTYQRPGEPMQKSERLHALMPTLRLEISAKGKAMTFNLDQARPKPLAGRIRPIR